MKALGEISEVKSAMRELRISILGLQLIVLSDLETIVTDEKISPLFESIEELGERIQITSTTRDEVMQSIDQIKKEIRTFEKEADEGRFGKDNETIRNSLTESLRQIEIIQELAGETQNKNKGSSQDSSPDSEKV